MAKVAETATRARVIIGNNLLRRGNIVQLIIYYYTTLSAVLHLARLKETFRTTVCVLYRNPFSLLELGYVIIINLLRSVEHP